ncbi:MAG TPA: hypothetical protein VJ440_08970 [Candidatus Brocadiaceae bacterium]|nr:hypothetical protein [Candidatus Brocadiaceae bacterium]
MEWKIGKGNLDCVACNKGFSEEEEYYSAIFDEQGGFIRKDFCIPCWSMPKSEVFFSFWKTKVPKQGKPTQKFLNTDVLLDMVSKLEGSMEAHQRNLRYVLVLYLIRKKVFKFKSLSREEGGEHLVIYFPREDREFKVYNPSLKAEEIESITAEMNQLLNYPYLEHEASP